MAGTDSPVIPPPGPSYRENKYLFAVGHSVIQKWNVKDIKYVIFSLLYVFLTGVKQLLQ